MQPSKEVPKAKFSVGQLVKCVMYDGIWVISKVWSIDYHITTFYRYEIARHDHMQYDIVEVWLSPVKILRPQLEIVGGFYYKNQTVLTGIKRKG